MKNTAETEIAAVSSYNTYTFLVTEPTAESGINISTQLLFVDQCSMTWYSSHYITCRRLDDQVNKHRENTALSAVTLSNNSRGTFRRKKAVVRFVARLVTVHVTRN